MAPTAGTAERRRAAGFPGAVPARSFRLMRYFMLTALVALAVVGATLYFLERMEDLFFEQVQRDQAAFFSKAQAQLARRQEEAARGNLIVLHEAGHLNMARLLANMLWSTDFAPFVAAAQRVPIDHCRAIPARGDGGGAAQRDQRRACFADVGRTIMSWPGFPALDDKAYAAMRGSTVFKIKVWDRRGIAVYSSEHRQIGNDGADNQGWKTAIAGRPASELTHRDRFSAFEGMVEDRDLISTYVPMRAAGSDEIVGVFEIYSDVTPFLRQIAAASQEFLDITAANETSVRQTAQSNRQKADSSSKRLIAIIFGLLAALLVASLLVVRVGQRIIDKRSVEQVEAMRREQQWHREKMAALATMAADLAHEVGNPLAVILGLAEELKDRRDLKDPSVAAASRSIAEQVARIATMTRQIADFATPRGENPEAIDVNSAVKAVCQFLSFDDRLGGTPIEFVSGSESLVAVLIPDHLNELMMNVLLACVEGAPARRPWARIRVETAPHERAVQIRVVCACLPEDSATTVPCALPPLRLAALRRRAIEIGGQLSWAEGTVTLTLPPSAPGVEQAPASESHLAPASV